MRSELVDPGGKVTPPTAPPTAGDSVLSSAIVFFSQYICSRVAVFDTKIDFDQGFVIVVTELDSLKSKITRFLSVNNIVFTLFAAYCIGQEFLIIFHQCDSHDIQSNLAVRYDKEADA